MDRPAAGGSPVAVLFIHGSPGDWKAWANFLKDARLEPIGPLIAVDRPGFGQSDPGRVMPDLRAQANLIARALPPHMPTIVVGHSLGGPIAAWLALDRPAQVCGAVMAAGSFAPAYEAPHWYNRLAATWLGRWLVPDALLWSNREILPLQGQLRQLDRAWPRLSRPMIAIQGEDDGLVDPRTTDYLRRRVASRWLTIEDVPGIGHFIPWEHPELVVDAIRSLAQRCRTG